MIAIFFFFNDTATTEIYTLSLHDALPISEDDSVANFLLQLVERHVGLVPAVGGDDAFVGLRGVVDDREDRRQRSEEHTSELQSPCNLVCRLPLEKKKQYLSYCQIDI